MGAAVLQAEAEPQDLALTGAEGLHDLVELLAQHIIGRGLSGLGHLAVGDEVPQVAVILLAHGGLQRDGVLGDLHDLGNLLLGDAQVLADLEKGRLAAQLLDQRPGGTGDPVDGLNHMDRNADGAGLVRHSPGDGLANPPGGVGGELVALGVVEFLHGLQKAHVALLDQIQQLHAPAQVVLGHGDYQAEIGFHHAFFGLFVAFGDAFGQLQLLLGGEQGDLADLLQIHADRVGRRGLLHILFHGSEILGDLLFHVQQLGIGGQQILRGVDDLGHVGDVDLDARLLQGVVDLLGHLLVGIDGIQGIQELLGGDLALLPADLDQAFQFLLKYFVPFHLRSLRIVLFFSTFIPKGRTLSSALVTGRKPSGRADAGIGPYGAVP